MKNVGVEILYANTWLQLELNQTKFIWEQLKKILNSISRIIKNLAITVLIVMTQHSLNTFGKSKKNTTKSKF